MRLASRRVLLADGRIAPATLALEGDRIAAVGRWDPAGALDLGERLLLPGIVDLHGDAFERQVMPRPGVMVDPAVGLADTDRSSAPTASRPPSTASPGRGSRACAAWPPGAC